MIELDGVCCAFGGFTAVADFSARFNDGGRYAIVGESGSGKTTTARVIAGLLKPTSGAVRRDGHPVYGRHGAARAHFQKVQLIHQDSASALDPRMNVGTIIAEPLRCALHLERALRQDRVETLLALCNLPADYAHRRPHALSGGEQKRVAIARALAVQPECLIFDEATNGFDLPLRKKIVGEILDLQAQLGFTLIFITHDMELAAVIADEIFVMRQAHLVEHVAFSGDAAVFTHPYSRMLAEAAGLLNT